MSGSYTSKTLKYNLYIDNINQRYFYLDRYLKSNQMYSQGSYQKIGFGKYLLIPDSAYFRIVGKTTDTSLHSALIFRMDSTCVSKPTDFYFYSVDSQKTISLKKGITVNKLHDGSLPEIKLQWNGNNYFLDTTGMECGYNIYYLRPSFITNTGYDILKDSAYLINRFGKLKYTSSSQWYMQGRSTTALSRTKNRRLLPKIFHCYFEVD